MVSVCVCEVIFITKVSVEAHQCGKSLYIHVVICMDKKG